MSRRILAAIVLLAALASAHGQKSTIIIKWSSFPAGYVLQSAGSLNSTNWTTVTNAVIVSKGAYLQATVPVTGTARFYRLAK